MSQRPTVASTWLAIAGTPIEDSFLEWPADVFGVTHGILERSQAFRFALSPGAGFTWPPRRFLDWSGSVAEAGQQWSCWAETRNDRSPQLVTGEWQALRDAIETPLEDLAEGRAPRVCEALLTLHAMADEACAGLGIPLDTYDGRGCVYRGRARELLARTGSLSRIPTHFLRVLPKVSTALGGTSVRSFSRYASVHGPGVDVRWHKLPVRRLGTDPGARHANLLLLPWPLRVRESDFRPLKGSVQRMAKEPFGFFEFAPSEKLDLDLVDRMIDAARDEVDSVDVVMLPESAVDADDLDALEALLDRRGVAMLLTGVRERSSGSGQLPLNYVHIGVNPRLEKGVLPPPSQGERWFHIRQNKHHRWSLDEGQILQYHLGGALHPGVRWWEATDVPRRTVHFLELGDEIALVCLVCEDLAQIDNVVDVVRSVGPTAIFTPLLDGPQLSSRWAARYASVLADDPGSAVLTLTSLGMVQRSRPHGHDSLPVIALRKDPVRGFREIRLEGGAQGVLVTFCGAPAPRRSADGRRPIDNATDYFDVAIHQVRAGASGSRPASLEPDLPAAPLELEDVTVLTGWAQALAEAMGDAPGSVERVLANASAGAPWRTAFGLGEASASLCKALSILARGVSAVRCSKDSTSLEEVCAWCMEVQAGQHGLETLVRRVLRAAMEERDLLRTATDSPRTGPADLSRRRLLSA